MVETAELPMTASRQKKEGGLGLFVVQHLLDHEELAYQFDKTAMGLRFRMELPKDPQEKKEAGTKVLASQLFPGLFSKTQWLSGLYYADFISFYSPTQLCGGGTTKSNSNELPISVPLSCI